MAAPRGGGGGRKRRGGGGVGYPVVTRPLNLTTTTTKTTTMTSSLLLSLVIISLCHSECFGLPVQPTATVRSVTVTELSISSKSDLEADELRDASSPPKSAADGDSSKDFRLPLTIKIPSEDFTLEDFRLSPEIPAGDLHSKLPQRNKKPLNREKRKVISRGGHYIIRSSSGSSPWSSTSYDRYSPTYRTSRPRGYGWNTRGPIGDSGIRTTTFGEIIPNKQQRKAPRKKLPRNFKGEIAQYAMQHGASKAAVDFEKRIGRRLRDKVVKKFVQRYKERRKKNKRKGRSRS